jgi:hypothetical protein
LFRIIEFASLFVSPPLAWLSFFANGIAAHNWSASSILSAGLGLGIAALCPTYFDSVGGSEIKALKTNNLIQIGCIHIFPSIIWFIVFGGSWKYIVLNNQALALPSSERWLFCASTFLSLITLGIIQMTSAMTYPISSLDNNTRSTTTTNYKEGIYSIVVASIVLVLDVTLRDSILYWQYFLLV